MSGSSSFTVVVDVIHPEIDFAALSEYAKTKYKKEFQVINAIDYVDLQVGRASRNESRHSHRASKDTDSSIIKGIKAKIDSESQKLSDSKKKASQGEKSKAKDSGRSKLSAGSQNQPDIPLYLGETEIVFCLVNYPFTARQYKGLKKAGINIGAFISLEGDGPFFEPDETLGSGKDEKVDKNVLKKQQISGWETDSSEHPGITPPLRWNSLKSYASERIIFKSSHINNSVEDAWNTLQLEIGKIIRCQKDFKSSFKDCKFIRLPKAKLPIDISVFQKIYKEDPSLFFSAISSQIRAGLGKPEQQLQFTEDDKYNLLFEKAKKLLLREVVHEDSDSTIDFEEFSPLDHNSIFPILYKLKSTHQNTDIQKLQEAKAVSNFYKMQNNFMAAAGHRFDTMIATTNKKLGLGLPSTFYDWQRWRFVYEHKNVLDELTYVVDQSCVIESYFEESVGILWVLALPPVAKNITFANKQIYMPPTLDGASDYSERIYDVPSENSNARNVKTAASSRGRESVAQIIKSGRASSLIPSPSQRLENAKSIYRMPLTNSDTIAIRTPFFFECGFRVDILRDIIAGKQTFTYKAFLHPDISAYSNTKESIIEAYGTRIFVGNDLTIFWGDYSLNFDGQQLLITSQDDRLALTTEGSVILKGCKIIDKDLNVGVKTEKGWNWTTPDGQTYDKISNKLISRKYKTFLKSKEGLKTPVRRDDAQIQIYQNGTMTCELKDITIKKSEDSVTIKYKKFPTINISKSIIDLDAGCFHCELSRLLTKLNTDLVEATVVGGRLNLIANEVLAVLSHDSCEFKAGDEILVAKADGTEQFGTLGEAPKRVEIVTSEWGNVVPMKDLNTEQRLLSLHEEFCPRFFAIRPGFSATEFIHETQIPACDQIRECTAPDITHSDIRIVTFHTMGGDPNGFIDHEQLSKQERIALLKTLQIPKPHKPKTPRRGAPPEEINELQLQFESSSALSSFYTSRDFLADVIKGCIENSEMAFQYDAHPPSPPPEQEPRIATPTPPPSLMKAMAMKDTPRAGSIGYWDSPESTFSFPKPFVRKEPIPLPPRAQTFDPVDPAPEPLEFIEVPKIDTSRVARPVYDPNLSPNPRVYRTEVSEPATASFGKHRADFGVMRPGESASIDVRMKNTGTRPIHFSVTPPTFPGVSIDTPPGLVSPGLDLVVRVSFNAGGETVVNDKVWIITDGGRIPLTIRAKVISNEL